MSSITLVGRDHGSVSHLFRSGMVPASKYRKHAFFLLKKLYENLVIHSLTAKRSFARVFFFFLPPYRTVGQHPRTARTYTLCIMYGGALKIYKYESHGGVVSVTSCPERCSFIHTRKKFQP